MVDQDRVYRVERQKVALHKFAFDGWHFDVGGGGEGIIGQLLGDRVVAIDLFKSELEQASASPALGILMDARDLKFIDGTFSSVSAFYSLMYMAKPDLPKVFGEVARVMKPGSDFRIWDHNLPPHDGGKQDIYVIPLEVDVGGQTVQTGYGVLWPGNDRNIDFYAGLAEEVGFVVAEREVTEPTFYLHLRKPDSILIRR